MNRKPILGVDPQAMWDKVGAALWNQDLFGGTLEETALAIVKSKILTDNELAFFLIAGTERLMQPKELHG